MKKILLSFNPVKGAALFISAVLMAPTAALAAGGGAGIDASFATMLGDLTGMLDGNFGSLILLVALIIGVAVYAFTSNWRFVISSVLVAFLIGYGVEIVQGIGGVTATTDMLPDMAVETASSDPSLVGPV